MRDPLNTAEDEAIAEDAESKEKLRRQREVDDFKWLMAHAQGRRFISRVLEESGVHRTSFHNSGSAMAFNEGRKHIGYVLTAELLEITPDSYAKLLKEYRNDN